MQCLRLVTAGGWRRWQPELEAEKWVVLTIPRSRWACGAVVTRPTLVVIRYIHTGR